MRRFTGVVVLLCCVVFAGCGPSASRKLIGQWQCNPAEALRQQGNQENLNNPMAAGLEAMMANFTLGLAFEADGTVTATMGGSKELAWTKHWKVTNVEGQKVTIELCDTDGSNTEVKLLAFVDDDHFTCTWLRKPLTFTRVREQQ